MWRRRIIASLLVLCVAGWYSLSASPVAAQGSEYGQDLKEAGKGYGQAGKESFKPGDEKPRGIGPKIGHAGKTFGKGTGNFFKKFGVSTGRFFKRVFAGE